MSNEILNGFPGLVELLGKMAKNETNKQFCFSIKLKDDSCDESRVTKISERCFYDSRSRSLSTSTTTTTVRTSSAASDKRAPNLCGSQSSKRRSRKNRKVNQNPDGIQLTDYSSDARSPLRHQRDSPKLPPGRKERSMMSLVEAGVKPLPLVPVTPKSDVCTIYENLGSQSSEDGEWWTLTLQSIFLLCKSPTVLSKPRLAATDNS